MQYFRDNFSADVEQMIKHAFCHCLLRCPDASGLQSFKKLYQLTDGDMREVYRGLAKSPEFHRKRIASETSKHPVEILYKIFLLREADPGKKKKFVKKELKNFNETFWIFYSRKSILDEKNAR